VCNRITPKRAEPPSVKNGACAALFGMTFKVLFETTLALPGGLSMCFLLFFSKNLD
jgi:hypothetical protein